MNISKFSKSSKLKNILVLIIFFSITTLIVSQDFVKSTENNLSNDSISQIIENYEEHEIFINKFNFYSFLSSTISRLPDNHSLNLDITLLSFFIVSPAVIIFKRYSKLNKSEVKNRCLDHQLGVNLSNQESLILDLVQEYLSKNRFLEVNKVIPYLNGYLSNSETTLNKNGIEKVIDNLIKKNVLVDGSKLTRDDVLDNSNRLMVYNLILENPGIHFMNIVNALGMSIFLAKWHINMLLKFNLINNTKVENREIYYDSEISKKTAQRLHFMSRERTLKIIQYLKDKPNGAPKYRISKELNIHPVTTTKYIQKLKEFDVLSSKQLSNKTLYTLNKASLF